MFKIKSVVGVVKGNYISQQELKKKIYVSKNQFQEVQNSDYIYIYIYQNNFTKLSNNLKTQKHSECPEIHNRVKTKCSKILICNSYLKNAF